MASAQESSASTNSRDRSSIRNFFFSNEFGLLFLILVFATIFALLTTGFTSRFNLYALGRNISLDVVIGFSMMVVI
jgi:ribose transport system permease protein